MSCSLYQNFEPYDPSLNVFEFEEGLMESPLSHDKDDDLDARSLVDLFHIGRSKWDMNCFYFEVDPIYDTNSKDEDKNDELGPYKQYDFFEKIDDINIEGNEVEWLLMDLVGPLNFSGIQGYPNNYEYWREELTIFHGPSDSPFSHISSFIDVISKLNINCEDIKMKMSIFSLYFIEDDIMDSLEKLVRERSHHF
jgi:hypothetical protein